MTRSEWRWGMAASWALSVSAYVAYMLDSMSPSPVVGSWAADWMTAGPRFVSGLIPGSIGHLAVSISVSPVGEFVSLYAVAAILSCLCSVAVSRWVTAIRSRRQAG